MTLTWEAIANALAQQRPQNDDRQAYREWCSIVNQFIRVFNESDHTAWCAMEDRFLKMINAGPGQGQ